MSKFKLDVTKEALVLYYIENYRGRTMKGEARETMYEVYQLFKNDGRTSSVCTCLDRDTHNKVENFINEIEWSEETLSSSKMKQVLPNVYVEPQIQEEESTQNVKVDIKKLQKAIEKKTEERKAQKVPVKPQRRRTRKK